ncbi:MAG: DUF4426 domain-containing protein [Gammaproteobacteria bacterium]|nr:DUF4426 domain-containing protein [Gammaproteobacteria bacterium]
MLSNACAHAEQLQRFGDWEVHYVVLPTEFLKPDVAAGYDIVRGRDRAFVNISVLSPDGLPSKVNVSGHSTNLLGQRQTLAFREVSEGSAVYYLAEIKHSDEEVVRFKITVSGATRREMLLEFQQKLYWDER